MQKQAEKVGTTFVSDLIVEADFSSSPRRCVGGSGDIYLADAVIVATGAQARWLGLESEQRFNGRGVSACATCDGFFYREQEVAVVGGGNTAVEESLYLANICSKVTLIHRRDELRAEKIMQERLFRHPKIEVIWDSVVEEVTGGDGPMDGVEGVVVRNVKTDDLKELDVKGLFVAIGHDPATSAFEGHLTMDEDGYILTAANSTKTEVPGIFAAGDCVDKIYRQAVTAAGMGCMAALEAEKYLAEQESHSAAAAE